MADYLVIAFLVIVLALFAERLNHKLLWVILSIGAMWILTIYYIKQ